MRYLYAGKMKKGRQSFECKHYFSMSWSGNFTLWHRIIYQRYLKGRHAAKNGIVGSLVDREHGIYGRCIS